MTGILKLYKTWLATATQEQIDLVDAIYAECGKHYEDGGDVVIETMEPKDILAEFKSVEDAKSYCGLKAEQALNARWGDDNDPQIETMKRNDEWLKEKP